MVRPPHLVSSGKDERRKSLMDRRSGEDRRRVYSLEYFAGGGQERRFRDDRRRRAERRKGWTRSDEWNSFPLDPEGDDIA